MINPLAPGGAPGAPGRRARLLRLPTHATEHDPPAARESAGSPIQERAHMSSAHRRFGSKVRRDV